LLKKPQKVTICIFFTRAEQLNSFPVLLLSLYHCPKATQAPMLGEQLVDGAAKQSPSCWRCCQGYHAYDAHAARLKGGSGSSSIRGEDVEAMMARKGIGRGHYPWA
jgi:hypothetical protein